MNQGCHPVVRNRWLRETEARYLVTGTHVMKRADSKEPLMEEL